VQHQKANATNIIRSIFDQFWGNSFNRVYEKHPIILISLLSIFLVTMLCISCLVCQYKYEKKKHQKWFKSQEQEKQLRRKSCTNYSNSMYFDINDYTPINQGTNEEEEDIDTIVSVMEDDVPLVVGKKVSRKKLIQILNKRFHKASKILQIQRYKNHGRICRTNSIPLPCEPFKHAHEYDKEELENSLKFFSNQGKDFITDVEVKKALASKIKRCKKGTYNVKMFKSRPPPPPPTSSPIPNCSTLFTECYNDNKQKRYSRSFSDLLDIIELDEEKTGKLLIRRNSNDSTITTNNNNNNVEATNKEAFTTTTASIETVIAQKCGK
jgi:hypothetical protein